MIMVAATGDMDDLPYSALSSQPGRCVVAELQGALDLTIARKVREAIGAQLQQGEDVEVDVSELEFIDSTELWALAGGRRQAGGLGRSLGFRGRLRPQPRQLPYLTSTVESLGISD